MLRILTNPIFMPRRNFKNFGHKRQPIPLPTTVWHGFLTLTFIGLGLEWDFISNFMFGSKDYDSQINEDLKGKMEIKSDHRTVI